jgi:hypothetical protein
MQRWHMVQRPTPTGVEVISSSWPRAAMRRNLRGSMPPASPVGRTPPEAHRPQVRHRSRFASLGRSSLTWPETTTVFAFDGDKPRQPCPSPFSSGGPRWPPPLRSVYFLRLSGKSHAVDVDISLFNTFSMIAKLISSELKNTLFAMFATFERKYVAWLQPMRSFPKKDPGSEAGLAPVPCHLAPQGGTVDAQSLWPSRPMSQPQALQFRQQAFPVRCAPTTSVRSAAPRSGPPRRRPRSGSAAAGPCGAGPYPWPGSRRAPPRATARATVARDSRAPNRMAMTAGPRPPTRLVYMPPTCPRKWAHQKGGCPSFLQRRGGTVRSPGTRRRSTGRAGTPRRRPGDARFRLVAATTRRQSTCTARWPPGGGSGVPLDDLQQLGLQPQGSSPDLVEKDRAALGHLQDARLVGPGVGEGPPSCSRRVRTPAGAPAGRAVDLHEGAVGRRD